MKNDQNLSLILLIVLVGTLALIILFDPSVRSLGPDLENEWFAWSVWVENTARRLTELFHQRFDGEPGRIQP